MADPAERTGGVGRRTAVQAGGAALAAGVGGLGCLADWVGKQQAAVYKEYQLEENQPQPYAYFPGKVTLTPESYIHAGLWLHGDIERLGGSGGHPKVEPSWSDVRRLWGKNVRGMNSVTIENPYVLPFTGSEPQPNETCFIYNYLPCLN